VREREKERERRRERERERVEEEERDRKTSKKRHFVDYWILLPFYLGCFSAIRF